MKWKRCLLGCVVLSLFVGACSRPGNTESTQIEWSDFAQTIPAKGVVTDMEIFAPSLSMLCIDSLLMTVNLQSDYMIDIFNLRTGKRVKSAVMFGRGPGEMLSLQRIQSLGDSLWLYDRMQQKMFGTTLPDLLLEKPHTPVSYSGLHALENAMIAADGNIVTDDYRQALSRFSVYDRSGKFLGSYGEIPEVEKFGNNLFWASESSVSTMTALPNGGFLVAYKRTDILEVYDSTLVMKKRIHGPDQFTAAIEMVEDENGVRVRSMPDERDAYFHPVVLQKRPEIWLLYSGELWSAKKGPLMNRVLVFDYDLRPLRVMELEIPVYSIAVDEEQQILYGATIDEKSMWLVRYSYN